MSLKRKSSRHTPSGHASVPCCNDHSNCFKTLKCLLKERLFKHKNGWFISEFLEEQKR